MRLLCIGDSNTWGYDARSYFGERYPASERWVERLSGLTGCECVNLGENGRCIPKTPLDVELSEDERVVVMLGSNDLLEGSDAAACAGRLERFVAPCRGGSVLIVAPAPFERGSWVDSDALVLASRGLAREYSRVAERLGQPFADAADWGVELCFDGVHFTPEGHRAFAKGLARAVMDKFMG